MSFAYPLGLLGLIGIPVIIVIYIIKNKYTEQVISSTYLWTLSEKFLKKRLPINKLVGIISLILQLLSVLFISFAIAQPVFRIRGAADDYCFILDGSGSMNIVQSDGKTRFESAKSEIRKVIGDSMKGSAYSLVLTGDATSIIFDDVNEKDLAYLLLDDVQPSSVSTGYTDALGEAQKYFNANPSTVIYLFTDKSFEETENVKIVNVAEAVDNYAVTDITYVLADGILKVDGKVVSYESDATLTVNLYLGDSTAAVLTNTVETAALALTPFPTFECEAEEFSSFRVEITQQDALAADNSVTVYDADTENSYSVLIVGNPTFYIRAALQSVGNARVKVVGETEYANLTESYDLYVFDGYYPAEVPKNGAVWFMDPSQSVASAGFTVQDDIVLGTGKKAAYVSSGTTLLNTLTVNLEKSDFYLTKYRKCGFYRNFTTIATCEGNPVIFTGVNEYSNREVVFAFDLTYSNFPVLADFTVLIGNLLDYTFPKAVNRTSYYCGETLTINVLANCKSISVINPSGSVSYPDSSSAVSEVRLTETGTYTVRMLMGDDTERYFNVFSAMPEAERVPIADEQSFIVSGEPGTEKRDGIYNDLLILFILLAVIVAADWAVYCYEQYQLR